MRILVVGASGFIGRRIVRALRSAGHVLICAGRNVHELARLFPGCELLQADLQTDTRADWVPRLCSVDAVINAAGVLRGNLEAVHNVGAIQLFDACAQASVACVLQVSALGAHPSADGAFLRSKGRADEHVLRLARTRGEARWTVLRPSLVIGRGSASTALFLALAAGNAPWRLGPGTWRVQPIHVTAFARMFPRLVQAEELRPCLDIVGPEVMTSDELTASLRSWLGLKPLAFRTIPMVALQAAAWIGDHLPGAMLTRETLHMLKQGSVADDAALHAELGWKPATLADSLAEEPASIGDLWQARLTVLRPFLVAILCAIWIGSGVASACVGTTESGTLLAGLGLHGRAATSLVLEGAVLDVALGAALLKPAFRSTAARAQLVTMAIYTALATVALPALWADPFAPLLKNLAVAAATLVLLATEA